MNKDIELLKIIFRDSPDILKLLNQVDKEIEKLQVKINKAIDYINKTKMGEGYKKMLLEILGSDKE